MGFLQPGEQYPIEFTGGCLTCKVLSFKQQREVVKLIKALQVNSDPEEAMNLVEQIITKAAIGWTLAETFSVDGLLEKIGFLEAMDIGKKITEGGSLSETERKK